MDAGDAVAAHEVVPMHRVLVVDDDDDARALLAWGVRQSGFACITARSGEEALALIDQQRAAIAVVVLDVQLAGMSGFDVARRLTSAGVGLPILLVSGTARSDDDVVQGLDVGAVDLIPKPTATAVLGAKVRAAYRRFVHEQELSRALRSAREEATIDELTRVYNRRAFDVRFAESIAYAARTQGSLALVMLDIDLFKSINDRHGHPFGDAILRHFAQVLRASLRDSDLVFRYGGEEFACLLPGCDAASGQAAWERLRAALADAPVIAPDGTAIVVRASAGLAVADPSSGYGRAELVAAADAALYAAKRSGRDRLAIA